MADQYNTVYSQSYAPLQAGADSLSGTNYGGLSTFIKNAAGYGLPGIYRPMWMKEQYQSTIGPVGVVSPGQGNFGPAANAQTVQANQWKNQQSAPASGVIAQTEQQTAIAANPTPSISPVVSPVIKARSEALMDNAGIASNTQALFKQLLGNDTRSVTEKGKDDLSKIKVELPKPPKPTTKGGVNNMSSSLQSGLSSAGSMLGSMSGKNLEPEQLQMREGIRSAIGKMGPIGAIISAASGVVDMVGDVTGLNLDNMDKNAAKRLGIKGAGMNNFMNALPGNSMIWGSFMGKTDQANKSAIVDDYRSGYSGSAGDIDAAVSLSNSRFLFGKNKINKEIAEANRANTAITNIGLANTLRKQSTYGEELASQNQRRYSGQTSMGMTVGKDGMKILPAKFAEGGKLNVIMDGSLHSRLNHLDEMNEFLADVTPKGIPVVSVEEGGKLLQHCEIEAGELILNKDLTTKIEALWHDGTEGAMIEAGKILAAELVMNTDDKTGKIIKPEDNEADN